MHVHSWTIEQVIELHLKDGRVLTCDVAAEDARFVQGENCRRLEKKIGSDFVTVAEVHLDAYAFLLVTDHVTLKSSATESGLGTQIITPNLNDDAGE